jgi:hypothetical protein
LPERRFRRAIRASNPGNLRHCGRRRDAQTKQVFEYCIRGPGRRVGPAGGQEMRSRHRAANWHQVRRRGMLNWRPPNSYLRGRTRRSRSIRGAVTEKSAIRRRRYVRM